MDEGQQESKNLVGYFQYPDGCEYSGNWNDEGEKHGFGEITLPDETRYVGFFVRGLPEGLGVVSFSDGAKYEGEFALGWFHGHGVFSRRDGMRYEGQFRGGRIWGNGLVTFSDGTHGYPRNEGYFEDCRFARRFGCPEDVHRGQKMALKAHELARKDDA